ncbi:PIG-L deacetylase family protein [Neobacillus sp. NPDC097160]|uniref:PIG-L deacetylase family protein n=1 Tax=Neobacillus sp. NPDC097160 TaxID=3364298 RepID=UPI0037FFBBF0
MLFISKLLKKLVIQLIQFIQGHENRIKKIEYVRGLYRYPNKMLGRKFQTNNLNYSSTDVLVFAAHPDDDILGLSTTLYRHSLNEDNIKVIFVTNGSGRNGESWYTRLSDAKKKSEIRFREAVQALSLINIPEENIYCFGYPDGGTQRYLKNMTVDILRIVQILNPSRIYVHCIEGGHHDHDMTSFVVRSICNKIGFSDVFEWAEYNPIQPLGTKDIKFLPTQSKEDLKEFQIKISEEERNLKRKMLAAHYSQDVEQFFLQGEAIRQAKFSQLELELYEHCKLPIRRLSPLVKELNNSIIRLQKK